LFDLIGLGLCASSLQIDFRGNTKPPKDVMAALYSLLKPQALKQAT
jgi:hypothetical protein